MYIGLVLSFRLIVLLNDSISLIPLFNILFLLSFVVILSNILKILIAVLLFLPVIFNLKALKLAL